MSAGTRLENANPLIFERSGERKQSAADEDEQVADPIDDREIFDILQIQFQLLVSLYSFQYTVYLNISVLELNIRFTVISIKMYFYLIIL